MDEDYGVSILTRRLLEAHEFLSKDGVVKALNKQDEVGKLVLAGDCIPKTDPKTLTTITVLHDFRKELTFGLPHSINDPAVRPTDDNLNWRTKSLMNV